MKESKTRDTLTPRKRKHGKGTSTGLESWDQTDLEDADEKVLEKRLHQLKMQLEMDQDGEREKRLPNKYRKKYSEEPPTSDTDSSDSESTLSSNSSGSVHRYKSKRSSSVSDDDRRKRYSRSPVTKKKYLKSLKNSKSGSRLDKDGTLSSKADKRIVFRKKTSPSSDKYSRKKSPKSPLLDRREIYSRVDTGRWHEKAKEFTKERNKRDVEPDKTRSRSRAERNRSISLAREIPKVSSRTKEDRIPKRNASRGSNANVARRKDSPEQSRARVSHDGARRNTTTNRKLSPRSPKDERAGRHDERRLDVKVTRRTDTRGDSRDVSLRITRDVRDRKEPNLKLPEKSRDREIVGKTHRDVIELNSVDRERNRVNDDRFKDRDKRLPDRLEPDRNLRALTHNSRDSVTDDKFRRNDRTTEVNRGGGVFDRMRNRYNDRRNAENNQRLNRERERIPEKEPIKPRLVDVNGADKAIRDRSRPLVPQVRIRSPPHRDRKELPEKTPIPEKRSRSPVDFEKRFPNPLNSRKAREPDNRIPVKRKSQENDDPQWNKKKTPNEIRSRSRSSERRRRKSSQEEWRVIDMTSPVLDDEFSDDNIGTFDSNTNRSRRAIANKLLLVGKNDEHYDSDPSKHKSILTDELSDISDEDFGDINPNNNNSIKTKKDLLSRNERLIKPDQINRTYDQKSLNDCNNVGEKINTVEANVSSNYVEDLISERKLSTQADNERVDFEKTTEDLDSEEETVSRVSDALGVDWTDLVEESKRRAPSCSLDASYSIRRRWKAINILARIGVSQKYAGEELYNEIENNIMAHRENDDLAGESRTEDDSEKLWHKIPGLHTCLKDKALKRRNLFEPHKTAISARKDIMLRRRLCGLPVKNLRTQQIIGVTHWLV